MVKGAFKNFRHQHVFEEQGDITVMKDIFTYESPFGLAGKAADYLFLKNYMRKLLSERNNIIKLYAEDEAMYKKALPL